MARKKKEVKQDDVMKKIKKDEMKKETYTEEV